MTRDECRCCNGHLSRSGQEIYKRLERIMFQVRDLKLKFRQDRSEKTYNVRLAFCLDRNPWGR